MRRFYSLIPAVSFVALGLVAFLTAPSVAALGENAAAPIALVPALASAQHPPVLRDDASARSVASDRTLKDGQQIFRHDTFGDEQLWTDVLRMHEVISTVDPVTALKVGLKVDVEALPPAVIDALQARQVNLTDPAVTVQLLRLDAIVGVKGTVSSRRLG